MNKLFKLSVITIYLLSTSCEKKITEIIPVMEIEKDMSIIGASNIKYFSFPSPSVGYAASESGFIYKTTDGGSSWTTITVATSKTCKGLEFFGETKGMCLMNNDVYVTTDGGQTWLIKDVATFIGKTDEGIGVIGTCSPMSCTIKTTINNGQTFIYKGKMNYNGFNFRTSRIVDNKVVILSNDRYEHGNENGFNLSNNTAFSVELGGLNAYEIPNDIYLSNGQGTGVGNYGLVMGEVLNYSRNYFGHTYPYYSVDGYGGFKVCVGEKTIVSNLDIGTEHVWNEVFDVKGNGFVNTFYKIRFITQNTFYISGSAGLILKARI